MASSSTTAPSVPVVTGGSRRGKRDKDGKFILARKTTMMTTTTKKAKSSTTQSSSAHSRHSKDTPSGGIESMWPSLIGVGVLVFAVLAQRGFRGRASVAGIDLGTTNSVVCIQAPSKSVGQIDCIGDPANSHSPIIPSVVSFLAPHERKVGPSSKTPSQLHPHPSHVVVGQQAKQRIGSHPHHTLYNAKRVLGLPFNDDAVQQLRQEVEFDIVVDTSNRDSSTGTDDNVWFRIMPYENDNSVLSSGSSSQPILIPPQQVGSYIVNHLMQLTRDFLGHSNVKSAVLAVPAKFTMLQRQRTMEAFKKAGVQIARVLEEPTAAALAYGLHKKENVEKILVYDFGGGTLDVSILHVSDGYAEVMGCDGDDRLGGADFDVAVAHYLSQKHSEILDNVRKFEEQQKTSSSLPSSTATGDDYRDKDNDAVEKLAEQCDRINDEKPLCTVSSFHTLGEALKISLSQQLLDLEEKHNEREGGGKNSQLTMTHSSMVAKTSCWAVHHEPSTTSHNDESGLRLQRTCKNLQHQELTISLEEYNKVVQPLFDRSILPVTRLLHDLSLMPDDMDEIVMVGGTTRMPQIRALVRDAFSSAQLNTHIDPDLTVAYGAASVID